MDNAPAIVVEDLGKRYQLGQTVDLQRTFRETLMTLPRFFGGKAQRAAGRLARRMGPAAHEEGRFGDAGSMDPQTPPGTFWALRGLNVQIRRGEAVGVIGLNGAGKSTLLKILSRITDPTTGRAEIHGRVGSLLEIGTGFNPELTGRENIYLNGSILGMRKYEIDRRFDEIVEFAGTRAFLDTPIKRYSSGMRVRLGFAVAAHLEPEIMIVDEVLAVGDAEFQKRCLGKMDEVASSGRTVLFVSHNMDSVETLCSRCLLLDEGRLVEDGAPREVISHYLSRLQERSVDIEHTEHRKGSGRVRFRNVELLGPDGAPMATVPAGYPAAVRLTFRKDPALKSGTYRVSFGLRNERRHAVCVCGNDATRQIERDWPESGQAVCRIERLLLAPGHYTMNIFVSVNGEIADYIINAFSFSVQPSDFFPGKFPHNSFGSLILPQSWELA